MRRLILLALAVILAGNAAFMLVAPARWAAVTPGVPTPFNAHFVRDIGLAYLVAATGLLWTALDARARAAALAGGAFLGLHGLLHIVEALAGGHAMADLGRDFAGVLLPPALALWAAWPRHDGARARLGGSPVSAGAAR